MKIQEFKKLIREEVRNVLNESTPKFRVGQKVKDTDRDPWKITKIYPNKKTALADLKKTTSQEKFNRLLNYLETLYKGKRAISDIDDNKSWYLLDSMDDDEVYETEELMPLIEPEANLK